MTYLYALYKSRVLLNQILYHKYDVTFAIIVTLIWHDVGIR